MQALFLDLFQIFRSDCFLNRTFINRILTYLMVNLEQSKGLIARNLFESIYQIFRRLIVINYKVSNAFVISFFFYDSYDKSLYTST